ncbi:MAG: PDZ domain-containing protein [Gammaproteobacteria bacterium]|nr:PDZ domain-containing protein [Gammaproteobacteria bacterium]
MRNPRCFSAALLVIASLFFLPGARVALAVAKLTGDLPRRAHPGFTPEPDGDVMKVTALVPGSPAARAGLKDSDQVLLVNGKPVSNPLAGLDLLRRADAALAAGGGLWTLRCRQK